MIIKLALFAGIILSMATTPAPFLFLTIPALVLTGLSIGLHDDMSK